MEPPFPASFRTGATRLPQVFVVSDNLVVEFIGNENFSVGAAGYAGDR